MLRVVFFVHLGFRAAFSAAPWQVTIHNKIACSLNKFCGLRRIFRPGNRQLETNYYCASCSMFFPAMLLFRSCLRCQPAQAVV
jgi:hypothetical protein